MADKKISQLSSASALTGAEPLAIVQDGVTKKTTVQDVADLALLFPNGFKEVTTSRDFQADDVGYVLLVTAQDVSLTMPEVTPFTEKQTFAIFSGAEGITFNSEFEDDLIYTLGGATATELIHIIYIDGTLLPFTGRIFDVDDSKLKTSNKYFYDKITAL